MAAALALLILPLSAHAAVPTQDFTIGETLACASKTPGKQLYVVIGRIEPLGERAAASVSLYDRAAGETPRVEHLPIDLEALSGSCAATDKVKLPLGPHFEADYAAWRKALTAHQAGLINLPVDEIDDAIRKRLADAKPQDERKEAPK